MSHNPEASLQMKSLMSLLLAIIVQPSLALIPCIMANATLPPGSDTINTSCTSVVFENVTAQGSMMINLSVAAMMVQASNRAAAIVMVSLRNLALLDGAVLAIDSSGYNSADSASSSSPTISILVQSLVGTDGALVFIGSFPAGTSILVSDANMTASSTRAPRLAQFAPIDPSSGKIMMLVNLSLRNNASFVVQRSTFIATASLNVGIPNVHHWNADGRKLEQPCVHIVQLDGSIRSERV